MPNWCINKLTIRHDDKSMLDKFEKAYRDDWTIETFYPTPREPDDPSKLIGEGQSFSINEGSDTSWYHWRLKNWGTKWDICLLYTSPSPRDLSTSRMPSSA